MHKPKWVKQFQFHSPGDRSVGIDPEMVTITFQHPRNLWDEAKSLTEMVAEMLDNTDVHCVTLEYARMQEEESNG